MFRNKITYLVALSLSLGGCKLADLRTEQVQLEGPAQEDKAVELLDRVIEAQNLHLLAESKTYTYQAKDEWKGIFKLMNPLPENNKWMAMRYRTGSFDGQVQYFEGETKEVLGVQSFKSYKKDGVTSKVTFKQKESVVFGLTAIQYMFEMPLRLRHAPILKYGGKQMVEGKWYETVLATWGSVKPNKDYDQYLLFIDPESGYLSFASYTIRTMYMPAPRNMYGSIRFEDFRENEDGIIYGSNLIVQINKLKNKESFAHRIQVKSLELNNFDKELLYPDKDLPFLGDSKD